MENNFEQEEIWRKDSKNWKWGLFYYNPEDKRMLVDKRNPNLGFTINFAHKKSYLFMVIILLLLGLVLFTVYLV